MTYLKVNKNTEKWCFRYLQDWNDRVMSTHGRVTYAGQRKRVFAFLRVKSHFQV